ncbi:hypothetical protein ACSAGD_10785 [Paramicrobacterium sp. CJ85]|uniref:hypothetical protein n=1 Tax=Paramicrobacterium sp. CJ85 TaxID=3445355 RepID=UPI003F61FB56
MRALGKWLSKPSHIIYVAFWLCIAVSSAISLASSPLVYGSNSTSPLSAFFIWIFVGAALYYPLKFMKFLLKLGLAFMGVQFRAMRETTQELKNERPDLFE